MIELLKVVKILSIALGITIAMTPFLEWMEISGKKEAWWSGLGFIVLGLLIHMFPSFFAGIIRSGIEFWNWIGGAC